MAEVNLYVDQGLSFACRMVVHHENDQPVDLTDAIIRAQFRKSSTSTTVYNFNVEKEDQVNGTLILRLLKEETAPLTPGRYIYACDYQIGDDCINFVKGQVIVSPRVTQ